MGALTGNLELGLRLAVALSVLCEERGHVREGCDWLEALMREEGENGTAAPLAALQARAEATRAWLMFLLGDYQRARPLAERSLARWRQLGVAGNSPVALNTLAYVARREGDLVRQDRLFQESLTLSRAIGDIHGSAAVLSWLGTQRRALGDLDTAMELLEESLQLYQTIGTIGGIAYVLLHLGGMARARHDAPRAQSLFDQRLALYQSLGDRADVAYAQGALAALAADGGDVVRAGSLCEECIATFRQLGDARGLIEELRLLGRIAALQGDDRGAAAAFAECLTQRHALRTVDLAFSLEGVALALARIAARCQQAAYLQLAVRLLGAAFALREGFTAGTTCNWSVTAPDMTHAGYVHELAATRAAFGTAAFDVAWSAGQGMPIGQAITESLATEARL